MLYDDLRKEKEAGKKLVTEHGACRFCGQMEALEVPPEWTEKEVDELATETCECAAASYYSSRKSRKERAHMRIEELFGQGDTQTGAVSEGAVELPKNCEYCRNFQQYYIKTGSSYHPVYSGYCIAGNRTRKRNTTETCKSFAKKEFGKNCV